VTVFDGDGRNLPSPVEQRMVSPAKGGTVRRLLLLAVAALVGAFIAPSQAATASTYDWALVLMTAGPQGAHDVSLGAVAYGQSSPHGAPVLVGGIAWPSQHLHFLNVAPFTDKDTRLRIAHGAQVTVQRSADHGKFFDAVSFSATDLVPGDQVAELVFAVHVPFRHRLHVRQTVSAGSVAVQVIRGVGSQAWDLGQHADRGRGAAVYTPVGGGGAGVVSHRAFAKQGLVGDFAWIYDANVSQWTWDGPDNRHGAGHAYNAVAVSPAQDRPFAGPPGSWRFTWRGVVAGIADPVLAAWAPIGPYWRLFA
jgi:hypothetical protein